MRRGSRLPNKKVYIVTEDDDERIRKTETKKAMIRAEFEKHKKELRVNIADPSKTNEIRLKNQLEELITANAKREKDLQRLENFEENLEQENLEATQFFNTMNKFNASKANETFLSAGFHPNRTTSRMDGLRNAYSAEVLTDKKTELMDTLKNIELLLEQEDEAEALVQERFEELRKNQVLVSKKVNELKRMNDHAEIRFTDMKKIEFLAFTKKATTDTNLKEMREEVRELKNQETTYKLKKEQEKKKDQDYLTAKQNEMSNILIELDKKRIEHQQKQEEVRKLEIQYEDVKDKRKNTKIVTKYIEALNALIKGKQGNLAQAHQALKELSERLDNSREHSPNKVPQDRGTPYAFDETPRRSNDTPRRRGSRGSGESEELPAFVKRDSILDRKYYIDKIRRFYDDNPDGPEPIADNLIQQYLDQCYQEESFKTLYEEQQAQKQHKENLLQSLEAELDLIIEKNKYITLGRTGSTILENNAEEAIDSGIVVINTTTTTLNQAKFEFEHKKESDNQVNLYAQTEAFVMRCYLDSIEMITRFSKVLASIYNQAGGYMSEELREISRNITTQIQQFRRGKKNNKQQQQQQDMSTSQTISDAPPEVYRTQTENSTNSASEREKEDSLGLVLDLQEIYELFLSFFEGCHEEAAEFVTHVRNDIIIASFITFDDIKNYLQNCQTGIYVDMYMQRAFRDIGTLRKIATENMLQKFEILYKLYMDLVAASEQTTKELGKYLNEKGVDAQVDILTRRKSDQNVFVKKALQKKWETLMNRYDYDPSRDYRRHVKLPDEEDQNVSTNKKQQAKDNNIHEKETYDKEDVKAKLNELGNKKKLAEDPTKSFFRGNEEEKKRFQAKKLMEKQKQAIENMSDEDYLNFQRRQIKTVQEDYAYDFNENQLLMKAQADLAQRLSKAEPLEELKKMIENSKFISKIQILEKQRSVIDGKRSLKQDIVEKYIPSEPIKVPKSAISKANKEYKIKTTRSTLYTPTSDSAGNNRFFPLASERRRTETDYSDSIKELSVRATTTKSTSRFKPQESPFDRALEPNRERSQERFKSNTLKNLKQWPLHTEGDDDNKLTSRSGLGAQTERAPKLSIEKRIIVEKGAQTSRDKRFAKSKSGKIDLPKLDKVTKKKVKLYKKKRNHSEDVNLLENENVNQFMNLQTDPLLKMVYSPSFFASSDIRSITLGDDLDYKFDAYRFKAPGLLVSEQI